MKAPDKIYIPIYPNYNGDGAHLGDDWFTSFQNSAKDNIEYIRKDTLLEWLQEARAIPHDGAIWRDKAFAEIITIINEM